MEEVAAAGAEAADCAWPRRYDRVSRQRGWWCAATEKRTTCVRMVFATIVRHRPESGRNASGHPVMLENPPGWSRVLCAQEALSRAIGSARENAPP